MKIIAKKATAASILLLSCTAWVTRMVPRATPVDDDRERGDVPGWVMITLMSAVLVAGLLALAAPALEDLFTQAMDKVGK